MNMAPSEKNYSVPRGDVLFRREGAAGFQHLGNCPGCELSVEQEKVEHYSSRYGRKEKDLDEVIQTSVKGTITLDETTAENLALAIGGGTPVKREIAAESKTGIAVDCPEGMFVELGVSTPRILRMTITGISGSFEIGETLTGGTSAATAKVAYVSGGAIECISVNGTFQAGEELTGTTSTATATAASAQLVEDVVAVDDATNPTTRYVNGTDYVLLPVDGLFRAEPDQGISEGSCEISCDQPGQTVYDLSPLSETSVIGELLVSGTGEIGNRTTWRAWKASVSLSGSLQLISDEVATIPMNVELLADRLNHPDAPFCKATVK